MVTSTVAIVSEAILDAAVRCFDRQGVRTTTIDDIAAEAGVSRITVYRQAGTREQVVLGALLLVTRRHLDRTVPRLLGATSVHAAMIELVLATERAASNGHTHAILFSHEERGALGGAIPGASRPLVDLFANAVGRIVDAVPGGLADGVSVPLGGEVVLRVVLSVLTFEPPTRRSAGTHRAVISRLLRSVADPLW